jgi:methionine-rich copper-binding protein CopC
LAVSRLLAAALCATLLLAAVAVGAHSLLVESSPSAGASVQTPSQLMLRFNNRIEKALSRLRLVDGAGVALPVTVAVGEGDVDRLVAGLPPLAPGPYRVEWQVLSADGHVVGGRFTFTVLP